MPELSRFLGVVILMHFREHNPPHFHARYNEFEAALLIETLGVMDGHLPPRVLSLVVEWAECIKPNCGRTGTHCARPGGIAESSR